MKKEEAVEVVKERLGIYSIPKTEDEFEYQIEHLNEAVSELEDVIEHISNTCYEFTEVYYKACEVQETLEEFADKLTDALNDMRSKK